MTSAPASHFLIVAAGHGARFGSELPKQYHELEPGLSVLQACVERLKSWRFCKSLTIVANPTFADKLNALGQIWVTGGKSRQESVHLGLMAMEAKPHDYVFIHDAARPLVSLEILDRLRQGLADAKGCIPVLPVPDTLKRVEVSHPHVIAASAGRETLRRVQTPQAFHFETIKAAHEAFKHQDSFTDDASLLQAMGIPVSLVPGAEQMMKITTALDLAIIQALYKKGY